MYCGVQIHRSPQDMGTTESMGLPLQDENGNNHTNIDIKKYSKTGTIWICMETVSKSTTTILKKLNKIQLSPEKKIS